jgi:hypothetical protein
VHTGIHSFLGSGFISSPVYSMGYCNLFKSSTLQCQEINCLLLFLDRPAIVPKMDNTGKSFSG